MSLQEGSTGLEGFREVSRGLEVDQMASEAFRGFKGICRGSEGFRWVLMGYRGM